VNNNYNPNIVVKLDFAVVKQVDGRAGCTRTGRAPPPPYQIMLDPSLIKKGTLEGIYFLI
jgi:hypothetical protein